MSLRRQWKIWAAQLCLLILFGGCSSEAAREYKGYADDELTSRAQRGIFLEKYDALRSIEFNKNEVMNILLIAKGMRDVQSNRVETLEALTIKDAKLRNVHAHLLKAERNILNGIIAFDGLMNRENITVRQYRNHLSSLEETVSKSEEHFTNYEESRTAYEEQIQER